jgi:hypothetical protein
MNPGLPSASSQADPEAAPTLASQDIIVSRLSEAIDKLEPSEKAELLSRADKNGKTFAEYVAKKADPPA